MLPSAHTGKRFPTFRGRPLTASATLVVRGKTQRPVENSTADESDDELLLTTKTCTQLTTKTRTHHKHSVCALPQTRTPDSDDELDLLSPNKTHPSSRSACTRDGYNDSSVDGWVLKGPRKIYRQTRVTTGFLDLPPELILLCLRGLPFEDIERCLTLNRQIYSLVRGCAHIRYRAKQDRAGVEENHYAFQGQPWTIPERMDKLRDLEKRWLEFRPTSIHKLIVHNTAGLPKVTADYFLAPHCMNGEKSKGVKYIKTSGGGGELESTFTIIDFTKPFVTFGTAIEEHDLIAAVYLYVLLRFLLSSYSYVLETS